MDEWSPRQPDSSGPPDDQSDGTDARQPRPENPYRIPQRPPGARPKDTGGLGFGHPRPADPEPSTPATEAWEAQGDTGGTEDAERPDRALGGGDAPWSPPEPETSSERNPADSPRPWDVAPADSASQDRERPAENLWDTPGGGGAASWDVGAEPAQQSPTSSFEPEPEPEPGPAGWGLAPEPPAGQDSWSHGRTEEQGLDQDHWNAPAPETSWDDAQSGRETSGDHPEWGRPAQSAPGDHGGQAGDPRRSWGEETFPERPENEWGEPAQNAPWEHQAASGAGEDHWGAPAAAESAPGGWEPSTESAQNHWGAPAPDPREGWGQTPPEPASTESWETPYRGQATYGGDTPYPGSAPLRPEDGITPQQENQGQGYEYLYSGPGGQGPGGPQGPDGPDDGYHDNDAYDPGPPRKKSRRGLFIGLAAVVVVLALVGGGVGWYVYTLPEPEEATTEYEAAWEEQDFARLAAVTTGDDAEAILGGIDAGLGVDGVDVEIGTPVTDGGTGSASYEVTLSLTNASDWGWEGELPLVREDGEWWVDFSPEVAYPGLGEGQVLARTAVFGERGQIQAADGTRLDTPDVSGSLQMIIGGLGEADEDDIERLGPAYSIGDTVGKSGLQRTYEERLAGEAATTILMVDAAAAEEPDSLEATEDNTLATLDGSDGESITTSVDMGVQNAASNAIIDADDPAGLVAIRPSTGEILAAVNVPGGFNRAFEGQYAPGSSFKIVTYSALLDNGLSTDATMDCPEEYELGGWPFRNAGEAEYGEQSVTEAFATSCNTALVHEIGEHLNPETLLSSAEQFGMNKPLDIGVTTHEPSFPPVDSTTMMGAQGIGQGQILTSPLHMATVPAAVADGSWRHPVLVTEPASEELPEPTAIANAEALRPMMRAVITDGTAKNVDFDGEVYGKTGTAEYGTAEDADEDDELPSHAWMVGYKGDVAFAVVVDGGGGGSAVAGPLAAKFTNAL
ncbi:penicillin-binding transpeptidase domain-containing protein [Nocardiopsis sp. JB363]|uniref:penicillin-binding transpeptidase domain-containing protein n=1 Tax=Nocardiopsis sp. JB363 TaxID=1434837 RepID=UPI00097B44DD|nr:penicillin-binding transpeptidase domain-containing protein [Nocardiopsis sp. JB363]SIO90255.1 Cell division protein FtsI [Peptidoglycan synthetase] [Nocardiopsis sp. JB363]